MFMALMASGASAKIFNFDSLSDWKADKDVTHYWAVVKSATVKDGYNIVVAEIIEKGEFEGKIVSVIQKPILAATETQPFLTGAFVKVTSYNSYTP